MKKDPFQTISGADWKVQLANARAQPNLAYNQIKAYSMRLDYTDITVVLDESGSMAATVNDTVNGFNAFLKKQKETPGKATMSLVKFAWNVANAYTGIDIQHVAPLTYPGNYMPAGSTALLDGMGRAIDATGTRLAGMRESDRPGKVVFITITDGEENASHLYTFERIKEMVAHQKAKYAWEFVFLGANIDAFAVGGSIGVAQANTLNFVQNSKGIHAMYASMADNLTSYRCAAKADMSFEAKDIKAQADAK